MHRILAWHLWPARNWPANAGEEAAFVSELAERAIGHRRPADRPTITAIMNALRGGVPVDDLLRYLPGARPEDLLVSYEHIEARRKLAEDAWWEIVESPTARTLEEHGPVASRLVAVPVQEIATATSFRLDRGSMTKVVSRVLALMSECREKAARVEAELARHAPPNETAIELGRALFDPHQPGLWANAYFLPARVGELSPVRLADILGERLK